MRTLLLTTIVLASFYTIADAQKLIAVQSGSQLTTYNTLTEAINAAPAGSDIYLPGGIFDAGLTIDKPLNIVGVGYNTSSTSATGISFINGSLLFTDNADGSSVTGIKFNAGGNITANNVDGFSIKRCWIPDGYIDLPACNNALISESCTFRISGNTATNILVDRCVIGNLSNAVVFNIFQNSLLCKNSVVFSNYWTLSDCSNNTFENSIFISTCGSPLIYGNSSANQFTNCLFSCDEGLLTSYNQLSTNCIFNQDIANIFVNHSGNSFDINNDYHLIPTSPGNNAGTDGTDIGIYGTSQPFKDGGLPAYPHILFKSIAPATDQNGNLLINVQVEAQGQ
jgi:hypothetical protein